MPIPPSPTLHARTVLRTSHRLGAVLAVGGMAHVVRPQLFDALIPDWLPGRSRTWTYASAAYALGSAAALQHPTTRRAGGGLAASFLVGVMPAKFELTRGLLAAETVTPARRLVAWGHLPWQLPMISSALRVARQPGASAAR